MRIILLSTCWGHEASQHNSIESFQYCYSGTVVGGAVGLDGFQIIEYNIIINWAKSVEKGKPLC